MQHLKKPFGENGFFHINNIKYNKINILVTN